MMMWLLDAALGRSRSESVETIPEKSSGDIYWYHNTYFNSVWSDPHWPSVVPGRLGAQAHPRLD